MTDAEWRACADPGRMLAAVLDTVSHRKLRLFLSASCRCIWQDLADERSRQAIRMVERWADGVASDQERHDAVAALAAKGGLHPWGRDDDDSRLVRGAARAAADPDIHRGVATIIGMFHWCDAVRRFPCRCDPNSGEPSHDPDELGTTMPVAQCHLLRDLVGHPSRPAPLDPSWLTWHDGTVPRVARAIYDERAFDRMPILGDALEDAGCIDEGILAHSRAPGMHIRGCWLLDLLLGKESPRTEAG